VPADQLEPIRLLIVGWYPGVDDPVRGRFIADQAEALRATNEVDPAVLSFEPFWLHGAPNVRSATASAWPRRLASTLRSGRLPLATASQASRGVPVGRLGTAAGRTPEAPNSDHEAIHRAASLSATIDALGRNRWALVHAHVGYPDGAAVAIASAGRLPFVMTEHAGYLARLWSDPPTRARYLEAALAARRVIAVSRVLADQIEAEFAELRGRVTVIPNTVDVAAFTPTSAADRDPNELLWVGYRSSAKGLDMLLRTMSVVLQRQPDARLRLVGKAPGAGDESSLRALAETLEIGHAVRFEGPADRAGVAAAMERAAVFVHPSRRETMGIVAVEALAAGLPVVATDSGGVTEVLGAEPDAVGAIVPVDDPESFAAAILGTLARRATFEPNRLRAAVESRYGAAAVAERLVALYREVLADVGGGAGPAAADERTGRPNGATSAFAPDTMQQRDALGAYAGRTLIVGFDPERVTHMRSTFPEWVVAGVPVVTAGVLSPLQQRQLRAYISTESQVPLDDRSLPGRLRWARLWVRRLRGMRAARRAIEPRLRSALDAALMEVRATVEEPALLVCIGGIDVYIALAAVDARRAVLAPGGIGWLADARTAGLAP